MPIENAAALIASIQSAELLSAEQADALQRLAGDIDDNPAAQEFAKGLVGQEILTRFQADQLLAGRSSELRLGKYVLLDLLGQGGMGRIYRARHAFLNREVALKILPPDEQASEQTTSRFEREMEAAARLNHPNIVTTHDAGREQETRFLVMEYIRGEDLHEHVRNHGILPADKAIGYLRQAAEALAYLHGQRMVHRDVKPSNLMLDSEGTVKVLDVGLAKMGSRSGMTTTIPQLTDAGDVIGTIDFMSPEQARDTRSVDLRSDIYGLGCTFFYLLTGKRLYEGKSAINRIRAHKDKPIPRVTEIDPRVPVECDLLLRSMVAKRPEDRFQSMEDLIACIDSLSLTADPDATGPRSSSTRPLSRQHASATQVGLQGSRPKSQSYAIWVAALALLGLVGWGGFFLASRQDKLSEPSLAANENTPPVAESQDSASSSPSLTPTVDNDLALWAFEKGGEVTVRVGDQEKVMSDVSQWPAEQPTLTRLTFRGVEFTDRELVRFESAEPFKILNVEDTSVTVDGIHRLLQSRPELEIWYDHRDLWPNYRKVAQWIVSVGGEATVRTGTDMVVIKTGDDIPDQPFYILRVSLSGTGIGDQGLARLSQVYSLQTLNVGNTAITDEGLGHLSDLWRLEVLKIGDTELTSAALLHFRHRHSLITLEVRGTKVNDHYERIARFPNLESLDMSATGVGDQEISKLGELKRLRELYVWQTQITSASTETLLKLPELQNLMLNATDFDGKRLPELASLPGLVNFGVNCRVVSSEQLTALEQFPALQGLWIQRPTPNHLQAISKVKGINQLHLIKLMERASPESLAPLARMTELNELTVSYDWAEREYLERAISLPALNHLELEYVHFRKSDVEAVQQIRPDVTVVATETCTDLDPHHDVANWVVQRGGGVTIRTANGNDEYIDKENSLPSSLFKFIGASLASDATLTDDDLIRFHSIPTLQWLTAKNTGITGVTLGKPGTLGSLVAFGCKLTDDGLKEICKNRQLLTLDVNGAAFSPEAVLAIKNLRNLRDLTLGISDVADVMPEVLSVLDKLEVVGLVRGSFDDRSLKVLGTKPQLAQLKLIGAAVTDDGLTHLATNPKLAILWLNQTKVTESGVAKFLETSPTCNVVHESVRPRDRPDYRAAVTLLEQQAECTLLPFYSPHVTAIAPSDLPKLPFLIQRVTIKPRESRRGVDLTALAGLRWLKHAEITSRDITAESLVSLNSCPALENLVLRDVPVNALVAHAIASIPSLRRLEIDEASISEENRSLLQKENPNLTVIPVP